MGPASKFWAHVSVPSLGGPGPPWTLGAHTSSQGRETSQRHYLSLKMGPGLPRHPSSQQLSAPGGRFHPCGLLDATLSSVFGHVLLRVGPEGFFSNVACQGVRKAHPSGWTAGMWSCEAGGQAQFPTQVPSSSSSTSRGLGNAWGCLSIPSVLSTLPTLAWSCHHPQPCREWPALPCLCSLVNGQC